MPTFADIRQLFRHALPCHTSGMETQSPPQSDHRYNTSTALGPVIDLVAESSDSNSLAGMLWRWLRRISVVGIAIVVALIALRCVVACLIASQVSQVVNHGARVAGLDAAITGWLGSVASLGLGFGAVGLVLRALLGQLLPFGRLGRSSWKPLAVLIAASGLGTVTPVVIKSLRGVDNDGLPVRMQEVDGTVLPWFNPAGEPQIWFARDGDGSLHFYDRRGHRESDAAEVQPVTGSLRQQWQDEKTRAERDAQSAAKAAAEREGRDAEVRAAEQQRQFEEAARRKAMNERADAERQALLDKAAAERQSAEASLEQARKDHAAEEARVAEQNRLAEEARRDKARAEAQAAADSLAARQVEDRRQSEASQRAESARQTVASRLQEERQQAQHSLPPPQPEAQTFTLAPGSWRNISVHGDRVEVWSDGPLSLGADYYSAQTFSVPGRHVHFNQGAAVIHARPAGYSATRLFIRKMR